MTHPVATLLRAVIERLEAGLPAPNWILGLNNPHCAERPSLCFGSVSDLEVWGRNLEASSTVIPAGDCRDRDTREIIAALGECTARLWAIEASDAGGEASTPSPASPS